MKWSKLRKMYHLTVRSTEQQHNSQLWNPRSHSVVYGKVMRRPTEVEHGHIACLFIIKSWKVTVKNASPDAVLYLNMNRFI